MQIVINPPPPTLLGNRNGAAAVVRDEDEDELANAVPARRGAKRPAAAAMACGLVSSAASFDLPLQPKKRGRPKGWKPGMPYSTTSKRPTSDAAKPRGRAAKKPPPTPREILSSLERRYVPFYCEWQGCRAELQNMDTLRRHVHRVHGRAEQCCWGACAAAAADRRETYRTNDDFVGHVEAAHLVPFQWHMGFGFRNERPIPPVPLLPKFAGCSGAEDDEKKTTTTTTAMMKQQQQQQQQEQPHQEIPAYLFNASGEQVTPWLREIEVESEATRLARRRKLRLVLKWMNDEALPEDEDNDSEE